MLERERERVAAAARRLASAGVVIGTAGNISQRGEGDARELIAITPTGARLAELEAEQVAVVDGEGRRRAGELAPTSEIELHLGVYRRYGSGAVVHTHPPIATALSCALLELPVVHYQLLLLGGPIRVARYETFGSPELAAATLEALDGRMAALMANHGAITHGGDLQAAVDHTLLLEWACEVYWRAAALGEPRTLNERQRREVVEAAAARGYGSMRTADDG